MSEAEVEEAIRRVRAGSLEAYETVVRAYQGRLRSSIARSCPPGLDADELAHRAFVEAFRQIDEYRPGTSFFAWLGAIARILLLVELRKARRETEGQGRYLARVVAQALEADLEAGSDLEERRARALRECLEPLPAHLRQLVEMRYGREAPVAEIARGVGRSVAAVKFQLFDLRRKLRECVTRRLATGEP
jgi:RNA polymerase sigma-70 factor (ECF subfamily)